MEFKPLVETIDCDRIVLKKHAFESAQAMFAAVEKDRKRLGEFLPWVPNIKSEKNSADYILRTHGWWEIGFMFDFSILRKIDSVFMGNIGVHNMVWEHRLAEIGYWILGEFEGQGYMREAVTHLEKELFKLGFHRIEIHCSSLNERSARVPLACGYELEARLKDHRIENGKFADTLIFSKLSQ